MCPQYTLIVCSPSPVSASPSPPPRRPLALAAVVVALRWDVRRRTSTVRTPSPSAADTHARSRTSPTRRCRHISGVSWRLHCGHTASTAFADVLVRRRSCGRPGCGRTGARSRHRPPAAYTGSRGLASAVISITVRHRAPRSASHAANGFFLSIADVAHGTIRSRAASVAPCLRPVTSLPLHTHAPSE
ncbi:hypothetical protein BKA62DRAFT_63872 [Auriculariales sp. MPI-PUGE-AT-0066]|nr:hypothetical protein BKA62DRAFT_63872 [Auriculariales sp. MPI-PUGE-AT-0066]